MSGVHEKIASVRERIEEAAKRSNRAGSDITLLAVTKGVGLEDVRQAIQSGIVNFGENRVQEAAEKISQVGGDVPLGWHMVGHLQSNKVKTALDLFHFIQSVDSVRLAGEIDREAMARGAGQAGKVCVDILLEVNISGQPKRFGFRPEEIYSAMDAIAPMPGVRVRGLMGLGPFPAGSEETRQAFRKLRSIFSVCKGMVKDKSEWQHLSMGMSDDFEIAIEEGSTMVRLGKAIFGKEVVG